MEPWGFHSVVVEDSLDMRYDNSSLGDPLATNEINVFIGSRPVFLNLCETAAR